MAHPTLVHEHLFLFNTLSRRKEQFRPRKGMEVKLFTCGPSLYRRQHLGNYRTFLYEDILERYLEFLGYEVKRVINFTDMEDKGIAEANATGKSLAEVVKPVEEKFYQECDLLSIRLPKVIPRATTSVEEAVRIIEVLFKKGVAYRHGGDVFFDPLKYEGFGRLFGLDMSRWPAAKKRFRKDTYPGQRWNLGDFILWHGYRDSDGAVFWETSLGKGRTSWNVQDAGMIAGQLGMTIDIHTGGVDNLFRHHDYTLAIMEAASGKTFCPYWMHGGHLLVDGAKMSKSRGNVVYPQDLLGRGFDARHLRFFLIDGPYRKKKNLSKDSLLQSARRLDVFTKLALQLCRRETNGATSKETDTLLRSVSPVFRARLNNDLDVRGAVDDLTSLFRRLRHKDEEGELGTEGRQRLQNSLNALDQVLRVVF